MFTQPVSTENAVVGNRFEVLIKLLIGMVNNCSASFEAPVLKERTDSHQGSKTDSKFCRTPLTSYM